MQYPALFFNEQMGAQNRNKGWSKGNAGKKRSGVSTFSFNVNLEEPETELVDEIAEAYKYRVEDKQVYRSDGGAKGFYHKDVEKLMLY
jgi:hypothetical protein